MEPQKLILAAVAAFIGWRAWQSNKTGEPLFPWMSNTPPPLAPAVILPPQLVAVTPPAAQPGGQVQVPATKELLIPAAPPPPPAGYQSWDAYALDKSKPLLFAPPPPGWSSWDAYNASKPAAPAPAPAPTPMTAVQRANVGANAVINDLSIPFPENTSLEANRRAAIEANYYRLRTQVQAPLSLYGTSDPAKALLDPRYAELNRPILAARAELQKKLDYYLGLIRQYRPGFVG